MKFLGSRLHPAVKGILVAGLAGAGVGLWFLVSNGKIDKVEPLEPEPEELYHADNDIVMTLRSVMDSFAGGDTISSEDYSFNGVLTDGEGRPLYTDTSGGPGEWDVVVSGPEELKLSNVNLGDLMPGQLESYLIDSLGLKEETSENRVGRYASRRQLGAYEELRTYRAESCRLEYYVRPARTATGKEGPLVTITVTPLRETGISAKFKS